MDFFTVPTITFGMLYCFFVISHDRRRILRKTGRAMTLGVNRETTSACSNSIPVGIFGKPKSLAQGGVLFTKNPYPSFGTAPGRTKEPRQAQLLGRTAFQRFLSSAGVVLAILSSKG
jgi:hypothetical protein